MSPSTVTASLSTDSSLKTWGWLTNSRPEAFHSVLEARAGPQSCLFTSKAISYLWAYSTVTCPNSVKMASMFSFPRYSMAPSVHCSPESKAAKVLLRQLEGLTLQFCPTRTQLKILLIFVKLFQVVYKPRESILLSCVYWVSHGTHSPIKAFKIKGDQIKLFIT